MKKLKKLKLKLSKRLKPTLKRLQQKAEANRETLGGFSVLLLLGLIVGTCSIKAPEIRDSWIKHKVGSKSYRIVQPGYGMGTGFAVEAPSGASYVLTNDHVCEMSADKLHLLVIDDNGEYIPRMILQRSDKSDLCLLEGMPGVQGLKLASSTPDSGDLLWTVGHPSGYLTTLTRGELIMRQDVEIPVGPISIKSDGEPEKLIEEQDGGILEEDCHKPKNRIRELKRISFITGKLVIIRLCTNVTSKAYFTTVLGQPGSSGSAVANGWGEIVGVLFAGDRFGWSIMVSLDDVKDFLKKY